MTAPETRAALATERVTSHGECVDFPNFAPESRPPKPNAIQKFLALDPALSWVDP